MLKHSQEEGPHPLGNVDSGWMYVTTPLKALMEGLLEGLPAAYIELDHDLAFRIFTTASVDKGTPYFKVTLKDADVEKVRFEITAMTRGGWQRVDTIHVRCTRPQAGHFPWTEGSARTLRTWADAVRGEKGTRGFWAMQNYYKAEAVGPYEAEAIEASLGNTVRVVTRAIRALAGFPD